MFDAGNTKNHTEASSSKRDDPLRLAGKEIGRKTVVWVGDVPIGADDAIMMAGPCSVESLEQVTSTALAVRKSGASILRGGAYKPRTSPYDFQGLGEKGLRFLREAGDAAGMPIVTEVMSEDDVALISEYADMLQIGARNMQNFALLKKVARINNPVLLKRGPSATVKEWLAAAEYVLSGGNSNVVMCERGIKTFDNSLRNTLDLAAVALVQEMTHLPVIVDPSHGTGTAYMVTPLARAGIAVGADGLMIEVHNQPELALSDSAQALTLSEYAQLIEEVHAIHELTASVL